MIKLLIFLLIVLHSNLNNKQQDKQEAIEIMVLLKYLSNFWRALVMPLINCKLIN